MSRCCNERWNSRHCLRDGAIIFAGGWSSSRSATRQQLTSRNLSLSLFAHGRGPRAGVADMIEFLPKLDAALGEQRLEAAEGVPQRDQALTVFSQNLPRLLAIEVGRRG